MRGKLLFGAAVAALMTFGVSPALAQTADQPGDASTTATLTGNVDGEISPAGDTDWFRLEVETGRRYNLALAGLENAEGQAIDPMLDRKSTRLNSSHVKISYAVFCLKKKKT